VYILPVMHICIRRPMPQPDRHNKMVLGMRYRARQAMYIYRNNEARPHNHCYRGKAVLHIPGV